MSITAFIVHEAGEIIELVSLIVCADFLGLLINYHLKKIMVIPCFAVFIGISVLEYLLTNIFVDLNGFCGVFVYYLKLALIIFILYGGIDRKIIYLIVFIDLSISLVGTSVSCIFSNIFEYNINNIMPFVKIIFQVEILIIFLFLKKNITDQKKYISFINDPSSYFYNAYIDDHLFKCTVVLNMFSD